MIRISTIVLIFTCLLAACVNPLKLLEADKPERAFTVSKRQIDRRMESHKPLRERELLALRESYRWLQDLQISRVEAVEQEMQPDRWLSLYPIYADLLSRRKEIEPYLPLLPKLKLRYDIATLEALTERSRLAAGNYCYEQAVALQQPARNGDKELARKAYGWLGRSIDYVPEEFNYQQLRDEMYDLATVRIAAFADENAYWNYPDVVAYAVPVAAETFRQDWLEVWITPTDKRIDYDLRISINNVYVSRDRETSSTTSYSKEVQDGCKTIEKKVTVGDSTYTVKEEVPIMIIVHGKITEVEQEKSANVDFNMQLIPINGRANGNVWQLRRYTEWSNNYSKCSGDSRALPHSCSGSCAMYPSYWEMERRLGRSIYSCMLSELCDYFPESSNGKRRNRRWFARF